MLPLFGLPLKSRMTLTSQWAHLHPRKDLPCIVEDHRFERDDLLYNGLATRASATSGGYKDGR